MYAWIRIFLGCFKEERLKIVNNGSKMTSLIAFGSLVMNIHLCLNGAQFTNIYDIPPTIDKLFQIVLVLEPALNVSLKLVPIPKSMSK